ncbi:MAG TPA: polyprenyl synthetase family protein [Bacilli bacterium]
MKLLDIFAQCKHEVQAVERELEKSIVSDNALLTETSLHLLKAGGKRIRPIVVLLSGGFGDGKPEVLRQVAVSLELIHMASLVHDDVIDDAETRRGQPTVKAKWDNKIAMYTGDYIFARALGVISRLENAQIHQKFSKAIVQMCIGEMEQIRLFFDTRQTIRDYLLRIRRKTALLIAISCQLGALSANASSDAVRRLYDYGYNCGMAFQIRDDILDLTGTKRQLGKPPGSDVKQGNITLPVIYALRDKTYGGQVLKLITEVQSTGAAETLAKLVELIRMTDGIQHAELLARRYIEKAINALAPLPDINEKRSLIEIAHFIGSRSS